MAGRTTKCSVGIQNNGVDAYKGDLVSASIWKRGNHLG